ncbi:VOC family protein [Turneriella parva]|uniref:Glyoxalase/bleomycin resistance protein/dioxygenase n=1 Tax=Turneriella parva (strain ATCC BAA-1111 / DSM 21527 / NCTC 11395 / H) TaxID=869212 RepID=I4B507_TURPD|nr:glyoxalase/bleomycin resistance/dioxygenase family protein [Turneriella parva]AFM12364.1 glyoxalase/bleomycin resistance protein/dioxygenase [Turneriella parva DSM 21527]
MILENQPPYVAIAHVVLETTQMAESGKFVRAIGMRPISEGSMVSVYEVRGGTHLILMQKESVTPGDAPFDLMVDDLQHAHKQFTALGLAPSAIEARPAIDHEVFYILDSVGHKFTVFSSHVSGRPV